MNYVNAGHIRDSILVGEWRLRLATAQAMGFSGVRVTFSVDQYMLAVGGSPVTEPAGASQLGITAFLQALFETDLRAIFNLSPSAVTNVSWGWPWPIQFRPPATTWDLIAAALNAMIDTVNTLAASNRRSTSTLEWELPNEWYWGGPGSSLSTYSGSLDAATAPLAAGYIASYGSGNTTCAQDLARSSEGLGTFDTDADWDSLATFTGKTGYANVRGMHDLLAYVIPQLDFHGMTLIGSSMDADPRATKLARNVATYKPNGYTYMDGLPLNIHLYDSGVPASIRRQPALFGHYYFLAAMAAYASVKAQSWALGLPVYWTEVGFRPLWVWGSDSSGFRERERGQVWAAIMQAMQRVPGRVRALYCLKNLDSGDDTGFNFGVISYAGNTSMGACALAASLGRQLDPATAPAYGGSYAVAAGESAAGASEPEF